MGGGRRGSAYPGDAGDFLLVNRFARRTGWLHGFLADYAGVLGVGVLGLLLVLGWWLAWRRGDARASAAVVWAALGGLVAVAVNQPIVSAVAEPRPFARLPHVLLLVSHSADYGFPSDHATLAGAVATGLCFAHRRLGLVAWVAALLLAFARVYVGVHYPHDVEAGLALGAAVSAAGWVAARPALTWLVDRAGRTAAAPLVHARRPDSAPDPYPIHRAAR